MFRPDFMEWFENLRLPPYHLESEGRPVRADLRGQVARGHAVGDPGARRADGAAQPRGPEADMGRFELQVLYARAMTKLWEKVERLRRLDGLRIADFGTRRRHSFLWQDWCVQAMIEGLGEAFIGTSNCLIAMRRDIEAIGTNAHELPMVYAALARHRRRAARRRPTSVLADWQRGARRATCGSSCPTPTARRASCAERARLAGRLDRRSASTAATRSRARRPRSTGGSGAARTRARSW